MSLSSLNRDLRELIAPGFIIQEGNGRNISYKASSTCLLLNDDIDDSYFDKAIDQRDAKKKFDPDIYLLSNMNSL